MEGADSGFLAVLLLLPSSSLVVAMGLPDLLPLPLVGVPRDDVVPFWLLLAVARRTCRHTRKGTGEQQGFVMQGQLVQAYSAQQRLPRQSFHILGIARGSDRNPHNHQNQSSILAHVHCNSCRSALEHLPELENTARALCSV